jgi:hypothetical protein
VEAGPAAAARGVAGPGEVALVAAEPAAAAPVVLPDHPGAEAVAAASEAFLEECWAESSVRNGLRRKHSFLGKARTP